MKERITIRMSSEMIARIDAWIARQPGYVSRQDAVRHCVNLILSQSERSLSGPSESVAQENASSDVAD